MSKSTKKKRPNRSPVVKSPFSPKEEAIMWEEGRDPEAARRNGPVLMALFQKLPSLKRILIQPEMVSHYMEACLQTMTADATLGAKPVDNHTIFENAVTGLANEVNPQIILNMLFEAYKNTKIKREKRVLLWAMSLIGRMTSETNPVDCTPIRLFVLASLDYAQKFINQLDHFLRQWEPSTFSYTQILEGTFTHDDWMILIQTLYEYEPHFTRNCAEYARAVFDRVKKPFGLRFHQLLGYGWIAKDFESSAILTPGQNPTASSTGQVSSEVLVRSMAVMTQDLRCQDPLDLTGEFLRSLRTAAFGEVELPNLQRELNAAVYCLLTIIRANLFTFEVYKQSGLRAMELNPRDEHALIIDIKSSPDNPRLYRKYGDLLFEKGEKWGSFRAYDRYLVLEEKPDEEIIQRTRALVEEFKSQKPQSVYLIPKRVYLTT